MRESGVQRKGRNRMWQKDVESLSKVSLDSQITKQVCPRLQAWSLQGRKPNNVNPMGETTDEETLGLQQM